MLVTSRDGKPINFVKSTHVEVTVLHNGNLTTIATLVAIAVNDLATAASRMVGMYRLVLSSYECR